MRHKGAPIICQVIDTLLLLATCELRVPCARLAERQRVLYFRDTTFRQHLPTLLASGGQVNGTIILLSTCEALEAVDTLAIGQSRFCARFSG